MLRTAPGPYGIKVFWKFGRGGEKGGEMSGETGVFGGKFGALGQETIEISGSKE